MEQPWHATVWAQSEFGQAELGHGARTKRAVRLAQALVQNPSASIPTVTQDPHQAKGAYRLLSNPEVSHVDLLSGHIARTRDRCRGRCAVLVLQDTTALSYTSHQSTTGLGPVNDRARARGFLAHTALAVTVDGHEVLGVVDQHVWARAQKKVTKDETCTARKKRSRESEHWPAAQHRIAALFAGVEDKPRVIAVFDREGDIFEAFEALDEVGHSFIIRACRNRLLDLESDDKQYSLDAVKLAPVLGEYQVEVPGGPGRQARVARMQVRAMAATVCPPRNRQRRGDPLSLNIVLAIELSPPQGVEPLCWYLVTREATETQDDVLAVIRSYQARWLIEELHMGIKTGCSAEERQLGTEHALENFLAFASVIAWQMLCLRDASRRKEPIPAAQVLTPSQLIVLCGLRPRIKPNSSAVDALRAIATLGGFMGRKGDGNPGWRTLWAGFQQLLMAEVGFLVAQKRSG
jgi:Transposase DNA-binding/Transposase Tn5 dimerisation domain